MRWIPRGCTTRSASIRGICRSLAADEAAGAPSRTFREFVSHPRRDAFWERRDLSRADVAVPGLHWSGWYDVLLDGSLCGWRAAAAHHGDGAKCSSS